MNPGIFFRSAAVSLLAFAIAVTFNRVRLKQRSELLSAELTAKDLSLQRSLREAETRCEKADAERASLQSTLVDLQQPKVAAPDSPKAKAATPAPPPPSFAERLQSDPEYQVRWLAKLGADFRAKFIPLVRQLGLSPAQAAAFENNIAKREEQKMDFQAIAGAQQKAEGKITAEIWQFWQAIEPEYQVAQKEVLGAAGYEQFHDYEKTLPARDIVNSLAGGAIVVGGEPLNHQQGEQLVRILANASASYRGGGAAAADDIDWGAVDAQTQTILSPAQLSFFQTIETPGGRFSSQLYRLINEAQKADLAAAKKR